MYDGGKIITGLAIFVVLVTFPYLINIGKAYPKPEPKIDTPAIQQMAEKKCVEPKQTMKTLHMQMLNDWRDSVVRDGNRIYTAADGKQYAMSLQNTCMKCHSNKKQFCDQCHNYLAVTPYCWDCHIQPKEKEGV